jgi:hypothetical protein
MVILLAVEFIARGKDVAYSSHPKQSSLKLSKNTSPTKLFSLCQRNQSFSQ